MKELEMGEMNHPVVWVKLKKYCELTGDSPAAVHARRRSDKWLDGVQCRVADDLLWVSLPEAQKWVETWGPKPSALG
jgi:hypothetical protein